LLDVAAHEHVLVERVVEIGEQVGTDGVKCRDHADALRCQLAGLLGRRSLPHADAPGGLAPDGGGQRHGGVDQELARGERVPEPLFRRRCRLVWKPRRRSVWFAAMGDSLAVGLEGAEGFVVDGWLLTDVGGTIAASVLSTPGMIGMIERTASMLVYPHLDPGQATVGFEVC